MPWRRGSRRSTRSKVVIDLGISGDNAARQVLIEAEVVSFTDVSGAETLVKSIRSEATAAAPAGLAGSSDRRDPRRGRQCGRIGQLQDRTQQLSLLVHPGPAHPRLPALLAPFLTLIPAVIVLTISGPVIAQAASTGIQVSSITQFMLIVLILGGHGLRRLPGIPGPRGAPPRTVRS